MSIPYGYGYYPQQTYNPNTGNMASVLTLLPYIQGQALVVKVDAIGTLWNDFKTQWNAVNPGNTITAPDFVK